jgi:Cu(I)/Ag(I) efflux system membrane fusion protein
MNMKKRIVIAVGVGLIAGLVIGRGCAPRQIRSEDATGGIQTATKAEIWTCSMHPQIRQPKPGKCPLCGMDLIPVAKDAAADAGQPRQMTLSPAARKLAEVAVAPVERRSVAVEIRMVGKVRFDETRLAYIAPRVPGRIDRLYANFTGMPVQPGDHLADLYSPELISAQQELLQTVKVLGGEASSASLLNATRERLRLWGLTAEQVAGIERSGQVRDHVTFYSPIGGIVVEKEAREGQYVETGMRLFTVADLSRVWVQLDAYESDLGWLRYAQEVVFQAEAYPGETFTGTISFIDPMLDPMTPTVKVRVIVANADGRLKPEMFVRAMVRATVAGDGHVLRSDLRGKWISPMHPEIVKDGPGSCDVCGMPLVRAEDLGYAAPDEARDAWPLVIPASAPLVTGKRAVVYVALPDQEGTYEGREVVLGPRAGDYFLVREGLQEGEQVVVNGAFKIDSSLQIQGKPSMMAPAGDAPPAVRPETKAAIPPILAVPEAFRKQLGGVLDNVLATADALANDDLESSRASAANAKKSLAAVDMSVLADEAHERWMQSLNALNLSADKMVAATDIEAFRLAFASLSSEMARVVKTFGPVRSEPVYDLRCPMAFNNRGATWLQKDQTVRNPYFGKAMLTCGEVVEVIPSALIAPAEGGHAHE